MGLELLYDRAAQWQWLLAHWQWSERAFFIVGGCAVHTTVFVGLNLLFFAMYKLDLFRQYKIQPSAYPSAALVRKCISNLLLSHLVIQWLSFYAVSHLYLSAAGTEAITSDPPSWLTVAWQLVLMLSINDCLFYWAHRLLHHRSLYARVHKQHHEFKATIGIAAEYAHPVESILANAIPTLAGPLLLGCHLWVFWLYLTLRIWETVESHSGYSFPWSVWSLFDWQGGAEAHDYHHSHNVGNYGGAAYSFWDTLMGTDVHYRRFLAEKKAKKA